MHTFSNCFSSFLIVSLFFFLIIFLQNIYSFDKYFCSCCVPGILLGTGMIVVRQIDRNLSSHGVHTHCSRGVDNLEPTGQILLAASSVNKVALKDSHAHLCIPTVCDLFSTAVEWLRQRIYSPQSLKYLL